MKSGGYNNSEDKYLENAKRGIGYSMRKITGLKEGGKQLNRALGLNSRNAKVMGKLSAGLKGFTGKLFSPFATFFKAFIGVIPKQLLLAFGTFTAGFTAFTSCGYLGGVEDKGATGNYISGDNAIIKDEEGNDTISYSNANANCMAYYRLLSEKKSVWQEYVNEDGETVLIHPDNENAVRDYFKNDLSYYIEPDLLFVMNKNVFGDKSVFPELFLNPVNYNDETYELVSLTDENGKLTATSTVYDSFGNDTGKKQLGVSDYGIASVLTYKEETETKSFRGSYIKQDVVTDDGRVISVEINEPFSFGISTNTYNVLEHAVTFAGDIHYTYEPSSALAKVVETGKSSGVETDVVEKYKYYSGELQYTYAVRKIYDESGNEIPFLDFYSVYRTLTPLCNPSFYPARKQFLEYDEQLQKGYTQERINEWVSSHSQVFVSNNEETGEQHTYTVTYNVTPHYQKKVVNLYKYRSKSSGVYIDFVNQGETTTNELGNKYLYDYLNNFSCYIPKNIQRDYNTFLNMTSQASNVKSIISSLKSGNVYGAGETTFEQIYNGSEEGKERLELMWDILIDWGYSEIQSAGIMGNIAQESSYNPADENSASGAFGLCQWLGGRKENLNNFVGAYNGTNTDVELQMNYACMEFSTDKQYEYCSREWLPAYAEQEDIFVNSTDLEAVTTAITVGWERCGADEANMPRRIANANACYEILSGRTPTHECMDIAPVGEASGNMSANKKAYDTSSATRNMTDTDKEAFNVFFHALDNLYDGKTAMEFTSRSIGDKEVDTILLVTNTYIYHTFLSQEKLNCVGNLWSANYLTDLADKKKTIGDVYGLSIMDSPRLEVDNSVIQNPCYINGDGGVNECIVVNSDTGSVLPNCVGWAWGRRYEIEGKRPQLSTGNAHTFWDNNTYYQTGNIPKAGAVMVWGKPNDAGHVAIVEQVYEDGTMTISQSGWDTWSWYPYDVRTATIEALEKNCAGGLLSSSYYFLGYIYVDPK